MSNFEIVFSKKHGFKKMQIPIEHQVGDQHVLVAPRYVGICGTDLFHMSTYEGDTLRLGHEWIGEVIQVGSAVDQLNIGDWVTTSSTLGCGACLYCQEKKVNLCIHPRHLGSDIIGALRGHFSIDKFNAVKLLSNKSSDVLIEVMAVAEEIVHLMQTNSLRSPSRVLVLGAGTVGILSAKLLMELVPEVVIADVVWPRVKRAGALGIRGELVQSMLMDQGRRRSFDVIIDATSDRNCSLSSWSLLPVFGAQEVLSIIVGKQTKKIEILSNSYAALSAKLVFMRGVPLFRIEDCVKKWSGKLDELASVLISHEFSVDQVDEAFQVANNASISGKVVVSLS